MKRNPAIVPIYKTDNPNDPIKLYDGPIEIEEDGIVRSGTGRLQFEWLPSAQIHLYVDEIEPRTTASKWFEPPRIILRIPCCPEPINLDIGSSSRINNSSKINFIARDDLSHVIFHLVNFHDVGSEAIHIVNAVWLGRATAEFTGWKITIDTIRGYSDLEKSSLKQRGYGITHAVKLEKADGSNFHSDQVGELLDALTCNR